MNISEFKKGDKVIITKVAGEGVSYVKGDKGTVMDVSVPVTMLFESGKSDLVWDDEISLVRDIYKEFIPTSREARFGDVVFITNATDTSGLYGNGDYIEVAGISTAGGIYADVAKTDATITGGNAAGFISNNEYFVVEPRVDTPLDTFTYSAYVEVDRDVREGDYIKIVKALATGGMYSDGDILKVTSVADGSVGNKGVYIDSAKNASCNNRRGFIHTTEYVVVERERKPFDQDSASLGFMKDEEPATLESRVAKLEELVEMLTDDIVMLDERTQPIVKLEEFYDEQ